MDASIRTELKQQFNEWQHPGSPQTHKIRQNPSPTKLMIILAYDSQGVSFVRFVTYCSAKIEGEPFPPTNSWKQSGGMKWSRSSDNLPLFPSNSVCPQSSKHEERKQQQLLEAMSLGGSMEKPEKKERSSKTKDKGMREKVTDEEKELRKERKLGRKRHAPSRKTVYNWVNGWKRGCTSTEKGTSYGRKVTVTMPVNISRVEQHILENRCITFSELETATRLAGITVHHIVHEHLKMGKVSARWVPKSLTAAHRQQCKDVSSDLLQCHSQDPEGFMSKLVIGDETWLHYHEPETKAQSVQ
ncbi:hypothetical protein ANN_18258 [Periplaneta americana]|uniref:Uncharacterized protein n=1 Tax=Periplaneta americana TaxID=6978 RepID=A0ABQ8SN92_PERAM|nr:hypothetical protein ANN_18258 [Periplaneta americana]